MDVDHYRIVDADYAIIGARADLGLFAKDVIDALRRDGLRTGLVMLPNFDSTDAHLVQRLAQVKAVGVFEYAARPSGFAEDLAACFLSAAEEPDWPVSHVAPRVYSAVQADAKLAPHPGHLIGVVKAMREYAPDPLVLMANGMVTPAGTANATVASSDKVLSSDRDTKVMKAAAGFRRFASVA